jgi:phosphate-selective porin
MSRSQTASRRRADPFAIPRNHGALMQRTKLALLLTVVLFAPRASADDAELRARVERLEAEVRALTAQLKQVNSETEALAIQQETAASASNNPSSSAGGVGTGASPQAEVAASAYANTTIYGYGEINYNRPRDSSQAQADLRRAVFGFGHRFDDSTRFASEFEFEHAVTSSEDQGEAEVEQFYIDRSLAQNVNLKAGLFLMPAGLLNESHEPTHYYGVERNFVETAIIPSTWREGGVGVYGSTDFGLAWDAGVTTGFDLSKWDPTSSEGRDSPLGSVHQELQLAKAKDLSVYGALNWRGTPGLVVGASVFSGQAGQGTPGFPAGHARVTLWDTHARWTPGRWDLSAVYARGRISDTAEFNLVNAFQPTPIPETFYGWYTQAAYRLWESGERSVSPFLRYERYNTASDYAALPAGLSLSAAPTESVTTVGLNFLLNPNVVIKTDYQDFHADSSRDRFDLGLGLTF